MSTPDRIGLFLAPGDIAELTGVRIGKNGRTRQQLQIDTLRRMKIPHFVNAVGRPIVARAVIEGGAAPAEAAAPTWEPRLAHQ